MSMDTLWNRVARVGTVLVILVLLGLFVHDCTAQTLTFDSKVGIEVWAAPDRCYQNQLSAEARAESSWGPVHGDLFMSATWWGACDAKVPGSLLNAEAGKVLERSHGADLYATYRGIEAGGTVRRRAVHHIWRHRTRNTNGFPSTNNAAWAQQQCAEGEGGKRCPFLGYWDGVRPLVGYEGYGIDARLIGPNWTWKDGLTLPWPDWIARASYESGPWTVSGRMQWGGLREWSGDLGVRRTIVEPFSLGVRAGSVPVPGWTSPLHRVTTTITIE